MGSWACSSRCLPELTPLGKKTETKLQSYCLGTAGRMDTAQWISQISGTAGTLKNAGPERSLRDSSESTLAWRQILLFFFTHGDQTGASLPLYHPSLVLHPSIFFTKYGPVPVKNLADSGFNVLQWSTIATRLKKNILKGYLVSLFDPIIQDQQHIWTSKMKKLQTIFFSTTCTSSKQYFSMQESWGRKITMHGTDN